MTDDSAAITVTGLTKRYGDHVAVDGVSFEVRRGEAFGILGPNGAGKTTTLEMIEGLRPPDGGEVHVLGMPVWPHPEHVQQRIGVQLQTTSLFDRLTARELLVLFAEFYRHPDSAGRAAARARSWSAWRARRRRGRGGSPAGQQQRLAIALALVHDPELVFLDEPTTGLDPQARHNLWDVIRKINQVDGKTVILTTHYLEEAEELCDRVAIMDAAHIVALDTPAGLIESLDADARVAWGDEEGEHAIYTKDAQATVHEMLDRARDSGHAADRPVGSRPQPGGRVSAADGQGVPRVNLRRLALTTRAQLQMTFRNRIALFWAIAFPMILLSLLGVLFGHTTNGGTVVVVEQRPHAVGERADPGAGAQAQRRRAWTPARRPPRRSTTSRTATMTPRWSSRASGPATRPPRASTTRTPRRSRPGSSAASSRARPTASRSRGTDGPPAIAFSQSAVDSSTLNYLDFLLPGIIAIAIMTSSVFGLSTVMVDWRKRGILRRLKLTPMPLGEFLTSRVLASLVVTVMQVVVLLIFGRVVFGIHIASSAWVAIPVALIGTLAFLAFGFFIGSVVANPETADAVSNAITTPMMFLSGTFFPVAALPAALAAVAKVLPLYYLADGLRKATVRGLGLEAVAMNIAVLAVMALIFAAISAANVPVGARHLDYAGGSMAGYDNVIVGGGLAGGMIAQSYREAGGAESVLIVGREQRPPYHRPPLTKEFLRGDKPAEETYMHPAEWWSEQQVELRLGTEVAAVDPAAKEIQLADGERIGYRRLALATGSAARPFGDALTIRTIEDSQRVGEILARGSGHLAVIGGGFIGVETAAQCPHEGPRRDAGHGERRRLGPPVRAGGRRLLRAAPDGARRPRSSPTRTVCPTGSRRTRSSPASARRPTSTSPGRPG